VVDPDACCRADRGRADRGGGLKERPPPAHGPASGGRVELSGQFLVQRGDELLSGLAAARPSGPQRDRGPGDRRGVVAGPEPAGTAGIVRDG